MNNRNGYFSSQTPHGGGGHSSSQTPAGGGYPNSHAHPVGGGYHSNGTGIPMRQEVTHSTHAHLGFFPPPQPAPVVIVTPTYGYGAVAYDDCSAREYYDRNPAICCNLL